MQWTIPETITAGVVVVFAIGLIYTFLGQRTDPKLLELFELLTKAASKRDEDSNESNRRLAEALDRNTITLDAVKSGIESSFNAFAQSIQDMVSSITTEHQMQLAAIGNIPATIMPPLEEITRQLEDHKGSVTLMNNTVDNQKETVEQILAAVLRLETQIGIFQAENQRLGAEIQKAQNELVTIKADVANLKPIDKTETKEETKS
jgi:chromosome segregation ATPase